MKKIALVTDSTADLPEELLKSNNINVIPLKVFFGDKEYLDGKNLKHQEFVDLVRTSPDIPTTSQPSPGEFVVLYSELIANGYDSILSMHISSKLSGTVNSANLAKNLTKNADIRIIDSMTTSLGLGMAVIRAASLIKENYGLDKLESQLSSEITGAKIFFTVKTLEFLQKNGRIGKAQAFLGNLLSLKPVLALQDGHGAIVPIKKVSGHDKVIDEITGLIIEAYRKNGCRQGIAIVHSCMKEAADRAMETLSRETKQNILSGTIGCVIGSHVGPEAFGIGIF